LKRALLLVVAGLLLAPGAPADAGQAEPADRIARSPPDDGRRTVRRFPANVLRAAVGVLHADNLGPLLAGGTATAAGSLLDDDVAAWVADPEHGFGNSLEDGAAPELVGLAVAGVFIAGRLSERPRFRSASYDLLDAFLVNWAWTSVLKAAVGRERPNGQDEKSLPSGHASNAFALASVLERHYGWKVGVPAYALASAVAASRLQRDKHYLSDVMAGATLGYVVGRTVVRVNSRPLEERGPQVSVLPVVGRRTRAVAVAVAF
jgi:membrane-associated phospholipid phosphatase